MASKKTKKKTSRAKPKPGPWRRRLRRLWIGSLLLLVTYGGLVVAGTFEPSLPTDLLLNVVDAEDEPELRAVGPTLVVLQHGLWRSEGSLWRLERALEAHGYEVLNESYPSTRGRIEDFAAKLAIDLDRYLAEREGPPPRVCYIGHSLGGLVIRAYLTWPKARPAAVCLFIASPHRGAILADKRSELWIYPWVMGDGAAMQLQRDDEIHRLLGPVPAASIGVIYGRKGDGKGWNDSIPGDDDGTVGVLEAQLPGEQDDIIGLPLGHTEISYDAETVHQVLFFLRQGRFDRD